jgi:hypothetical protein
MFSPGGGGGDKRKKVQVPCSSSVFKYQSMKKCGIKIRGPVVNTPASYSGGPGFISRPGDQLS